jgi:UDP-GlcNAc:undecaprenyl-phosphate GlcNAc-1-phosphate transferase
MVPVLLTTLAFSVGVSILLTPGVIRLAHAFGVLDIPNERKIHSKPTPRLGGLAVAGSCAVALTLVVLLFPDTVPLQWFLSTQGLTLFGCSLIVLVLGVLDDRFVLSAHTKFLVQLVVATAAWAGGLRISMVSSLFGVGSVGLELLSYPATVLWLVGMMNAVNLIDGLDGLAAGIGAIAATSICAVSIGRGEIIPLIISVALAGSLFGFLRWNFHPARIFLGDSGSLLVGFLLGSVSLLGSAKGATVFAVGVPVLAFGVPLADMFLSVLRRMVRVCMSTAENGLSFRAIIRAVAHPDRDHIHHRMLGLGIGQRDAVIILYGVSVLLGIGAFSMSVLGTGSSPAFFVGAALAMTIGIRRLKYDELTLLRNGVLLRLWRIARLESKTIQVIVDTALLGVTYAIAYTLIGSPSGKVPMGTILLTTVIQLAIFWSSGMYRISLKEAGMRDALKLTKVAAFAAIAPALIEAVALHGVTFGLVSKTLLDFFLIVTFVQITRFSYHLATMLAVESSDDIQRVLLYGAGPGGVGALQYILAHPESKKIPIGFLDDDAALEGKSIHGFPVFGGHWRAQRIIRKHGVNQILLATEAIPPMVLTRLRRACRDHRISLTQLRTTYELVVPAGPVITGRAIPKHVPVEHGSFEGGLENLVSIPAK